MEQLERRIADQERELKEWIEYTDDLLERIEEDIRTLERWLGFRRGSDGKLVGEAASRPRTHPELVTVEPLSDDGKVFGEALPVVAEWRPACARWMSRPTPGPGSRRLSGC